MARISTLDTRADNGDFSYVVMDGAVVWQPGVIIQRKQYSWALKKFNVDVGLVVSVQRFDDHHSVTVLWS